MPRIMALLAILLPVPCGAGDASDPVVALRSEALAEQTQWFRDAKFGMFIHWGLYSQLGAGERVMLEREIPVPEYETLVTRFDPVRFSAKEWVALAKRAGMRYVTITAKHHDGFCMFDSAQTDYDIASTPFGRDVVRELTDECHRQGLRVGLYYSILDWHHPDYVPAPAWQSSRPSGDFDKYLRYMAAQLRELCTGYGQVDVLWYDAGGDHDDAESRARFAEIDTMVRQLQPDILINERGNLPGDIATFRQHVPASGWLDSKAAPRLWESSFTMNAGHGSFPPTPSWGYDENEKTFRDKKSLIRLLVDVVARGGNLQLNVGPKPDGSIQSELIERLEAIGDWMFKNQRAIYGSRTNPFRFLPFHGRATAYEDRIDVIVFDWPTDGHLRLPGLVTLPVSARLLEGGANLSVTSSGRDVLIAGLPETAPDTAASVLVVDLTGPPKVEPLILRPDGAGRLDLPVLYGDIHGNRGRTARFESVAGALHLTDWNDRDDFVAWDFEIAASGVYRIVLEYACDVDQAGSTVDVRVGATSLPITVSETGGPIRFAEFEVGKTSLAAGKHQMAVVATKIANHSVINLRGARLTKIDAPTPKIP